MNTNYIYLRTNKIILIMVVSVILASCGPRTTMIDGRQCIQPKISVIPAEMPHYWDTNGGRNPRSIPRREAIPHWMESQFNFQQQTTISKVDYSVDMAINENEIWLAYFDFVVRYNRATNQLDLFDLDKQNSILRIYDVLITKDHNLWIIGTRLSKGLEYAVLLRFNSVANSFEVVEDANGLLHPVDGERANTISWRRDRVLKEAQDGTILFIIHGDIYAYNPSTNEAMMVFSDPEMSVASIESDPRGFIWFTILENDHLWMLDPGINQLQSFELPDLYPGTSKLENRYFRYGYNLYLDSQQRVWIPAWGYLDTQQERYFWRLLEPTPLFVSLYDTEYVYTWDKADTFEAQDGAIWFTSQNGILRYDVETTSICWIAPDFGPIVELPDGEIWILLKNQLYKYNP